MGATKMAMTGKLVISVSFWFCFWFFSVNAIKEADRDLFQLLKDLNLVENPDEFNALVKNKKSRARMDRYTASQGGALKMRQTIRNKRTLRTRAPKPKYDDTYISIEVSFATPDLNEDISWE